MKETLAKVDQFENDMLKLVDDYILRTSGYAQTPATSRFQKHMI